MKNRHAFFIFTTIVFGLLISQRDYIGSKLCLYVSKKAEKKFGTESLDKEQEEKIKAIANKMDVLEPINIRRMNRKALVSLGYHNAFAHFPALFDFIPVNTRPFLFVSEGFFEDLSPEEQLFLIGHEMVHIKEHHTRYLKLVFYFLILGLLFLWWTLRRRYKFFANVVPQVILLCTFLVVPNLACLAYKRHIERVADHKSIEKLKSYDGGICLIERWVREFNMPKHNSYFGLFSDHPSYAERKACCSNLKNRLENRA